MWRATTPAQRLVLEQQFYATLLNSPSPIVMVDQAGQMLLVNSALEELSGYSREELVGQPVELLVPEELRHAHIEIRKQYVREPRTRRMGPERELLLRCRDGSVAPVEIELSPVFQFDEGIVTVAIISDVASRKRAEAATQKQRDELKLQVEQHSTQLEAREEELFRLTSALNTAEGRERQRIAELLHDHVQQLLVAAKLRLHLTTPLVDPQPRALLEEISSLLRESIDALRTLSTELTLPILKEAGMAAGLEWLAKFMDEKYGFTIHLRLDQHVIIEDENTRLILFQCVRELLFNVVKHANVHEATVEQFLLNEDTLRITVSDSGEGFDVKTVLEQDARKQSFGLRSIRERLSILDGRIEVDSAPGQGATFTLVVPLH